MDWWIAACVFFAGFFLFAEREVRHQRLKELWTLVPKPRAPRKLAQHAFFQKASQAGVSETALLTMALIACGASIIGLSFAESSWEFGLPAGGAIGLLAVRGFVLMQWGWRTDRLRRALMDEAIPIGAMALSASGSQLEAAFVSIAQVAKTPEIRQMFSDLNQRRKKLNLEPADALLMAAREWDVPEMIRLAEITKASLVMRPNLGELWDDYNNRLRRKLGREDRLKARTSTGRRNALAYMGIVGGIFGLGYPHVVKWLTPMDKDLFFIVMAGVVFGAWMIWKSKDRLNV